MKWTNRILATLILAAAVSSPAAAAQPPVYPCHDCYQATAHSTYRDFIVYDTDDETAIARSIAFAIQNQFLPDSVTVVYLP